MKAICDLHVTRGRGRFLRSGSEPDPGKRHTYNGDGNNKEIKG